MDTLTLLRTEFTSRTGVVDVEIVIPVYNEQDGLVTSVERLHQYLTTRFPLSWAITIADNASTDRTWVLACRLAQALEGVRALHLDQKGRGRALRAAWSHSDARVVAYMDVDLSTDLDALLPLVAPLLSGHSDVSIGTRLAPGSRVVRGAKREFISRTYNWILRTTFRNAFSDAQCGFKAVRTDVAQRLVPMIEDQGWFFDTELLVLAEHNGLRIHEVPVDWVDDADSRVDVVSTAREDLKGVLRMIRTLRSDQGSIGVPLGRATHDPRRAGAGVLLHFAAIGTISTLSFALLFALLYGPLGPLGADVVALTLCAIANLAANRRYTFGDAHSSIRAYYRRGALVAILPFVLTLTSLGAVIGAGFSSLVVDLMTLTIANLSASLLRYRALRKA